MWKMRFGHVNRTRQNTVPTTMNISKLETFDGIHYKIWWVFVVFIWNTICDYIVIDDCVLADMPKPTHSASTLIYES